MKGQSRTNLLQQLSGMGVEVWMKRMVPYLKMDIARDGRHKWLQVSWQLILHCCPQLR
uniref:Uncharacterized protein n=1 Tax=Rhizophora mucronata TaxID=61149 RepID=A0A2P2LCA8_RHIMU